MNDRNRLKVLRRLSLACEEACALGYEYQCYLEKNLVSIDVKTKLKKLHSWQYELSNLLTAVLASESVFVKQSFLWENLRDDSSVNVEVPDRLSKFFDDSDDISLSRVLAISRNWGQHIQKINQEKYCLLADTIDFQIMIQILYKIYELINGEIALLSEDELQLMLAVSSDLNQNISALKVELAKLLPYIHSNPLCTEGQKKMLRSFMEFEPDEDNVKLIK